MNNYKYWGEDDFFEYIDSHHDAIKSMILKGIYIHGQKKYMVG